MKIEEFINQLDAVAKETNFGNHKEQNFFSVGNDMSVNTFITVDSKGKIWIRQKGRSFLRVLTCFTVYDVEEIRKEPPKDGTQNYQNFWIICRDEMGFYFSENDEVYICKEGRILFDSENFIIPMPYEAFDYFTDHPVLDIETLKAIRKYEKETRMKKS